MSSKLIDPVDLSNPDAKQPSAEPIYSDRTRTYKQEEVSFLLKDLFKYLQAADDSGKTPQEKLDFYLADHDFT